MSITYTPIDVRSGYDIANINTNFLAVQTALLDALSLSGTIPNTMTADLDMGSQDIVNGGVIRAASFVQAGNTLDLVEVGIVWQGDWADATNYVVNDGALQIGTTYRCILDHLSDPSITKPGTGSAWETYWVVLALKGTDGAGVGDMVKATYDSDNNGIVDQAEVVPFSGITSKPTTLSGYGITDAQGIKQNLTDIGVVSPVRGDILYFDGTAITNLGAGTVGHVLRTNGTTLDPSWGPEYIRQISNPVLTSGATVGGTVTLMTKTFQCNESDSRISFQGGANWTHGTLATSAGAFIFYLYVDGVSSGVTPIQAMSYTGGSAGSFQFMYTPGDTSSHVYTIRASAVITSTVHLNHASVILTEMAP